MGLLDGKVALVTGGSRGIGKAIALKFASEGADVVFTYLSNKAAAEQTEQELGQFGHRVKAYASDASSFESAHELVKQVIEDFSRIDILVNNAGIMDDMAGVDSFSDEKLLKVFSVNVYGPFYATRKAVNTFKAQGSAGAIVHIASEGAYKTCAGAVYCASKAAVVSLSRNTAYMYMKDGIRSNCIIAGGFKTEISNSMGMPNMEAYGKIKAVLDTAPEPGEAVEIARACLFLASDEAAYVSGAELAVDGGWCAS